MKIADFSVKNSLMVNLLSVVIVIAGVVSYFSMRKEAFPPVNYDIVMVTTSFRGASPAKTERLVTIPIEREIRDVDGIDEIVSSSDEGISQIMVKIDEGADDTDKVIKDIEKAVDRVTDLPSEVDDRPFVTEVDAHSFPVISVALSSTTDEFDLREKADALKETLENIAGVSSIVRGGWRDEEYWVEPDLDQMKYYHISFSELADALRVQNVDMPGGKQEFDNQERSIKIVAELRDLSDVENTVVRANDLGKAIRVKDVATVSRALMEDTVIAKSMGNRAITLTVMKGSKADIIKVVDDVKSTLADFKTNLSQEFQLRDYYDMSYYVKRRLKVLKSNGLIGFVLVVIVLFVFLPPVSALFTAFGIPIAFLTTFICMYAMGLTVNLLTMFGLIMVLGIIVDDGIIISENVFSHIEKGMNPREAAIKGTDEVAGPVLCTVLTTIVAFSPLMFMSGILGKFIRYIPMVVIIALCASLIEAFFILPSHLADFAKAVKEQVKYEEGHWFYKFQNFYEKILRVVLNKRYWTVLVVVFTLFASIFTAVKVLPFELFSAKGLEFFSVQCIAKPDTSLDRMNELVTEVEKYINKLPAEYLETYSTSVGMISDIRGDDPTKDRRGSNYAQLSVYLTPASKREKEAQEIVADLRLLSDKYLADETVSDLEEINYVLPSAGPPVGADVDVAVRGEHYETILVIAEQIKTFLAGKEGVYDVSDNYELGSKELNITIDQEKARKLSLTNSKIAYAVRAAFSGVIATSVKQEKAEKEINVLVKLPKETKNDPDTINEILVENKQGNLVPLKNVIKVTEGRSLRTIKHVDGKKVVSVMASLDKKKVKSLEINQAIMKEFKTVNLDYPGYSLKFRGENEETQESMVSLMIAFLIALILIYVILAVQFNSLGQPLIIMLTIPFALIGVVVAFILHGEPLGFLSVLGYIGLMGVVVNDSIVLVDFINKHRDGRPIVDSVVEGGRTRLRPVLITTVTTVFGLATVAYGIGGSDPILKPMALAMSWGLFFATFLTLLVIPCVYLIANDAKNLLRKCRKNTEIC